MLHVFVSKVGVLLHRFILMMMMMISPEKKDDDEGSVVRACVKCYDAIYMIKYAKLWLSFGVCGGVKMPSVHSFRAHIFIIFFSIARFFMLLLLLRSFTLLCRCRCTLSRVIFIFTQQTTSLWDSGWLSFFLNL